MLFQNNLGYLEKSIKLEKKINNIIKEPRLIEKPEEKNILVLSPHFDDEILGCGGVLRKHVLNNNKISILYVTDGSKKNSEKNKEEHFLMRKKESEKACRIIGIKNNEFYYLKEPEGYIEVKEESINNLCHIIKKNNPNLIYIPWFLDNHIDHFKTNKLLYQCYKKLNFNCMVCAYEIWTPIIPNIIINISKEFRLKKKALKEFKSQLKEVKYNLIFKGLNKYRTAYNLNGNGYAEAFLYLDVKKYFEIMK
ncbi:MAG: PIG-L family deacetylase [Candidatus Pacearchaeota archaeon]